MFNAFVELKKKYVKDEKSFRDFYFYLDDFCDLVSKDMNETAVFYQCKDHYATAASQLGISRTTLWRATKK